MITKRQWQEVFQNVNAMTSSLAIQAEINKYRQQATDEKNSGQREFLIKGIQLLQKRKAILALRS